MNPKIYLAVITLPAAILLITSLGVAEAQTGLKCTLESLREIPDVRVTKISEESAPVPHCNLAGVIGTEINFELLLPDDWNGKFVMGGGGGFAGSVVNGAQDFWGALQLGYATVGTDTGHQAHSMTADWALNNLERLVNFGHVAVHRTAVTSKALIEDYYGQKIARSYFAGCSRGGGQALMEAQRYPKDFDGIVAAAPAYNWTHELGARWIRIAQLMYPDPTRIEEPVIDPEALKLIGDAVMAQCDDLDGLSDGVLNDPRQCDFDVSSLACEGPTSSACLSPEQVKVAEAIYGNFEIDGQVIPGTPVGAELPGWPVGWELWHTGGYKAGEEFDYHEGADADAFSAPAIPSASDFAQKAARVASTLNADNPDLSAFRAHGGKLIIDNGWMDGSMSAYGTLKYYENVLSQDPTARDDVRLFLRPGVTHCMIGPGPDGTNYLVAIDEWVESGEAPGQLPAPFRALLPGQPEGGGRILCAHPNVVTYNGNGDPRDPASFSCQLPR